MSMAAAGDLGRQVRTLFLVALALFLVTIVIGIVNGLDLYEFDRNQLLTHVHAGTLGWLSLAVIASALWLTRSANRMMTWAFAILVPVYVLAFYSGSLEARAVTGVLLLLAMLWLLVWGWQRAMADRSLPVLAVALGLTSFFYGGVIGVLLQVQLATGTQIFGADADVVGAHASTMVFSYLILVAMGIIEQRVKGTLDRPLLGLVQLVALFGGGLFVAVVILFLPDQLQAAGGVYLLIELVAVVLFAIRILPSAIGAERYTAISALWVVVAMAIFMYFVFAFLSAADPTTLNFGIVIASDHAAFIGVMTNLLIGLMLAVAADRMDGSPSLERLAFWVMNAGLVVFLGGLITETTILKQIGAPSMGIALIVLVAIAAMRLRASNLSAVAV